MAIAFAVFAIGVAVTLVVAKGMMQASDFAKRELEKLDQAVRDKTAGNSPEVGR
jgi:hypothetical protein